MKNEIRKIISNRNINRCIAVCRYSIWQLIKILNLFPRVVNFSNSKIKILDRSSANEGGGLLYTHRLYDSNNMNLLLIINNKSKQVYFDVGANKGVYSLLASENIDTVVFAFEPHPVTYNYLLDNIELNNRPNIHPYNLAIGDFNGKVRFTNVDGSSTNKIILSEKESNYILVPVITLDEFCNKEGVTPSFIKIDVEGFENDVIKGGLKILNKVNLLQIEISLNEKEVLSMLESLGFAGPYYYDHKNRTMRAKKFLGCEDPIFINKIYKATFIESTKIKID